MKNNLFGLTHKELLIIVLFIIGSVFLIVYSSMKLVHKYYKNDKANFFEIQNQSSRLVYLNDLNAYALNIQRNALNMLIYKTNVKEVKDIEVIILKNRDSLLVNLTKIDNNNFIPQYKRTEILNAGLNYLNINKTFLKLFNDSINNNTLTNYNTEKMRPAIRVFSDLLRKNTALIVEKIQYANGNRTNLFKQIEFWFLLLGLAPYLYFLYRLISIAVRVIFWGIFPNKFN